MSQVGRNDPCPCGSGKKYKKCCVEASAPAAGVVTPIRSVHDLDGKIVGAIRAWAELAYGEDYAPQEDFPYPIEIPGPDVMLFAPWCVYDYFVDGARVVEHFLADVGSKLPAQDRAWVEAQIRTWVSVWEVLDVEPGTGMEVRDLLTGEQRFVREVQGSRMLVARDAILARVVDFNGSSYFCGMHPHPMAPQPVAVVVGAVRKRIVDGRKVPKSKPLPSAWLQEEGASDIVIGLWQDTLETMLHQPMPKLQNTDGDDLLETTDHYDLVAGTHDDVELRVRALPWAEEVDASASELVLKLMRPGNAMHTSWQNTVVGTVRLARKTLRVEANSVKRADLMRELVEVACGDRIRWRAREHKDPAAMLREPGPRRPRPEVNLEAPPPEVVEAVRAMKAQHYAGWVDAALPALGGRTPRQAVKTVRLREKLEVILKEMENGEMRQPEGLRFDIRGLRRELGMKEEG